MTRTTAEIEHAYERAGKLIALGLKSSKCGQWTCLLAVAECVLELFAPRRVQAMLTARLWLPLFVAGVGFVVVSVVLLVPAMTYRAKLAEEWRLARMRKEYPEGCTCIRGALVDNPHCPHHGEQVP